MNGLSLVYEALTRTLGGPGWTLWLKHLYQLSSFLTGFSFMVIAFNLYRLVRSRRTELPAPGMFVLGTIFLLSCGLSHVCNVTVFYFAPYRLYTLIDLVTAAAAVAAACRMPGLVSWMVQLPPQEYVHTVNKALEDKVSESARTKDDLIHELELLRQKNHVLEHMIRTKAWISDANAKMKELSLSLADREAI